MKVRSTLLTILFLTISSAFCLPACAQEIVEAAKRGDLATVKRLIQKDPQLVHVGDVGGSTALHWAGANGHVEVMQFLIDHGADINVAENVEGWTPIMSAACFGSAEPVRLLIKRGAFLEARRKDGNEAIHTAASFGREFTVLQLIQSGVDINTPNGEGNSPLAVAAGNGQRIVVINLIAIGADISQKNKLGRTARDLALQNGKNDVVDMLDHYQAMLNDRAARDALRREAGLKIRTSYANWSVTNAQTRIVYQNDFVSNLVGPEWSTYQTPGAQQAPLHVSTTPKGGRHFLGELGSQAARLTLNNLPEHSEIAITFDILAIRSWDGNDLLTGPDIWSLSIVDGMTLLQTTFMCGEKYYRMPGLKGQSYPGEYPGDHNPELTEAIEHNSLGYTFPLEGKDLPMDAVFKLRYTFPHKGATLQLDFAARGLEELSNESWGITNIEVSVPVPPPIAKKPGPQPNTTSPAPKATPTKKISSPPRTTARAGGKKTPTTKKTASKPTSDQPGERLHDKKTPPKP